jgi:hypothetical protein
VLDIIKICSYNYPQLLNVLLHEVHHALSKRSKKGIFERYIKKYLLKTQLTQGQLEEKIALVKEEKMIGKEFHPYIKDPEEFDAIGAEISTKLLLFYCTKEDIDILYQWLKSGGKIENLPDCLKQWKYIIEVWNTKPTLYKRLLLRFYGLVIQMKEKLINEKLPNQKI